MLSKNNLQERLRKMEPKKNHYSIRKFTVGVASVLIGMTFMEMSNGQTVKADTVTPQVRDQETQVSQEKNSAASELSNQKVNEQNAKNKTEETEKTSPLNDSVNSAKTEKTNSTNEVSPQSSNNTSVTSKSVTVDSNKVVHTPNSKKDNKINSTISNKVEENLSENKVIKPSTNIKKSESTTLKIDPSKTTTGLKASLQSPEITNKKLQELIKTALFAKSSEEENITDATNYPDTNGLVSKDQYIFNQFHLTRSLKTDNLTPDGEHLQSLPLVITLATDRNNPGTDLHYYVTDDDYTKQYAIGDIPVNQSYTTNEGVTIYNFGPDGISLNSSTFGLAYIFGYGKGVGKFLEDPYDYHNVSRSWGDVVPKKIKHTVSYINEETGEEMPGMPKIVQTGLTGQNYNVFQVNKKVIDGYYLTNSSVAQGTLSQFKKGDTFTRKWVDRSGNTIYENWYQLDNKGLMQATINVTSPNGTTYNVINKDVVGPDGSVSYGAYNFTNPYVPSTADIKLLYAPVGKIIPVDEHGKKIPNAPQPRYTNDPDDATNVTPNEPVPTVPGYTPSVSTVTPADPGKDTPVIYNPVTEKGSVIVTVHDNTDKVDLPQYGYNSGEEKVGSKVDFNKSQTITELTNKGYKVINPDVVIPAEITKGSNTVTIYVEHTTTTVTPDKPGTPGQPINPNNPEGPKYPEGTDKNSLIKTGTQTVHYVGAGDKTPSDKKQSFDFTRSITFDNVTGEIKHTTAWNATSHTFGYENTPLVDGYHADRRVAGGTTVTPDDLNKTVIVNYNQNGKIVPVDPEGNPIPNVPKPTYPTDPSDPTKVVPNEPVPNIPGMTPSTPTVTPADPGKDTPVIYNPVTEKGSVIVTVHDNTDKVDLPQYGYNSGEEKVGSKVDFNKSQTITELTNKGYKVINPDVVIPAEITKGSNTVTIYVEHTTTTVTPDKPGTPGQPINPNNPEGPKYPEGTDKNSLIKTGTQTVHYVGAGDKTPSDKKQSFDFTRSITFDNVTGEIKHTTAWNATSHTFGYENTPLVDGYHADRRVAGGTTVTPDDLNKTVIVNYNQNGKIVPVDPEGNPIPNVPKPTYPTDPSDPTKVVPNEPVPNIPGMTPSTPTVTPADPGKDTPVSYTPVENPTPEEPLPTTIEGTQTIKFETEDGTQLESPNVQKAQFTGSHTFGKVNVPVIPGYVATQTTAGGLTVTESKPNVGQTVIYKKIGKIIPVDSNGNPIPNANQPQYTNDPTNPTKVVPNESVPDVPGYTPESSTVTPVDPTTDTPVVYKKDEIPRKPITSHKSDKETPSRPKEETSSRPKEETSSRPKGETSENYESALTTANNTNVKGENAKSNIGRAKAAAHQNTLPQTGEKDTETAGLAGLALMAVAGMISLLGGKDRKRKKN